MNAGKPHTVMLSKRAVDIVRDLHPDGLKPDDLVVSVTGAALTKMLMRTRYGNATAHGTRDRLHRAVMATPDLIWRSAALV
jgi:hypothetical protein